MPRKKRSLEEIEEILRAFAQGSSIFDISVKYDISQPAFYRILKFSRGQSPNGDKRKSKIEKLESELRMREKEIRLLKAALKKS